MLRSWSYFTARRIGRAVAFVSPDGEKHDVLVEIHSEPNEYVARMTGRRLGPANSFWTMQARSLLSDFL